MLSTYKVLGSIPSTTNKKKGMEEAFCMRMTVLVSGSMDRKEFGDGFSGEGILAQVTACARAEGCMNRTSGQGCKPVVHL